ncbi:MAG: polysaccharide export outer membrane protein [Granulosicoccus sp.]
MRMLRLLSTFVLVITVLQASAQISQSDLNIDALKGLSPSEVPSESVLRALGLSQDQIEQAMLYKSSGSNPDSEKEDAEEVVPELEQIGLELDTVDLVRPKFEEALEDPVFGQEVFRNNRIRFFESAKDVIASDNYKIGIGDKLALSVWGFSDYNEQFLVTSDGYIESKLVGRVYLKGLSFDGTRKLMRRKFSQVLDLNRSEMDITLQYSRDINVNIVGEVLNPGSYNIAAVNSAFNAMVVVGGPTEFGSVRNILVKRKGKTTDTLDVYDYLSRPTDFTPPFLEDGDHLVVPVIGPVVSILGEVRRPLRYEIRPGEGLMKAIEYAGGLKAAAYRKNVQIVRFRDSEEIMIDVNLDSLQLAHKTIQLQDGDKVLVRTVPEGFTNTVSAKGAFRVVGDFELRDGDRISELLQKAEGVLFDAYLNRAYVLRLNSDMTRSYISVNIGNVISSSGSKDNIRLKPFDEVQVLSKKDFEDAFNVWVYGAVRKGGELIYGSGLSLKDALFLAGGLKPEAANRRIEVSRMVDLSEDGKIIDPIRKVVKTLQIEHDLSVGAKADEFQLQPYDQIFVRVNPAFDGPKVVSLLGEVNYPGTYSILSRDEKVSSLIERAGGLRDYAFPEGVKMRRLRMGDVYLNLEKAIKKPNSRYDLVLNAGDTIDVPKVLDIVSITGAIANYDGHAIGAPYFGKRANYYVKNFAGGFNKRSHRSKTYVIHANGIIKKTINLGLFKIYPKVTQGSEVVVMYKTDKADKSERPPVDWNRVIENTTIKVTGILTLWLLIDRIVASQQ